MSNEEATIHDFDFDLICEYFAGIERQGPGSPEMTKKAVSFINNLSHGSKIADIGCGTGGQTMVLAQHAPGSITGIDLFPRFIDLFNSNAAKFGLSNRVQGIVGEMTNLHFTEGELDLIWSEGAIYNIGFERGMNEWRKFLKPGGYIAVTEASWFTDSRPDEINDFWMSAYPGIDTISNTVAVMQRAGYETIASFKLPESCWEDFYLEQAGMQDDFLRKHAGNKMAIDLVKNERREAELYSKYKQYYGYVFYIGRKTE